MSILKEDLIELLNPRNLSDTEYAGKISVLSRGLPYYGRLHTKYPYHWISWCCMHNRIIQCNLDTDFPRTALGFVDFILYLGEVPDDMINPTTGRLNHNLGYTKQNFVWQSKRDNSSECGSRVITNTNKHSPNFKKSTRLTNFLLFLKEGEKYSASELKEMFNYFDERQVYFAIQYSEEYLGIKIEKLSQRNFTITKIIRDCSSAGRAEDS